MPLLSFTLIETILFGAKTTFLLSTIGKDIILKTLSATSESIISITTYILDSKHSCINEIKQKINIMDLQFTITIIKQIIQEQNNNFDNLQESVKKAILGVNYVLKKIEKELKEIIKNLEYHETLYFNQWRNLDCDNNINEITNLNKILMKRYNLLIDLLKIYNCNTNSIPNDSKINKNVRNLDQLYEEINYF